MLALVVGAPNLVYQATHSWPQLSMGRALAAHNGGEVRAQMWLFLLLILGPPLVPIWIAGIVGLVRRPEWRQVRFLAAAFPVLLALVFAMGAQFYYPFGLLAVLYAAGCVPAAEWMSGSRRNLVIAGVALNAAVGVLLALPLVRCPRSVQPRYRGSTRSPAIRSAGPPTYARSPRSTPRSRPPIVRTR